ncbi:MAG TPA: ABC transporter ATP-binding protein [Actinomycetes bacterium]|nr:ABC transporter ATP-binding protein [Actinomycetes bacterium]
MPRRPEPDTAQGAAAAVTPTAAPLLQVHDLQVHYPLRGTFLHRLLGREAGEVRAVDGVSFEVARGEVLGLVGESGSGKTTLGRALLRLVEPTAGSIRLEGRELVGLSEGAFRPLRQRLQMVFQDPHASLSPGMNLLSAIGHPLVIHGLARDRGELRQRVAQALERVGLVPVERFLTKYPGDLSGGQKQRAVLARAIILGPELLVADEPVSMLDMSVRAKILELMLELKAELGLTYLYITHDLATAKFFCDRIAIMYLGRIVEIGPAQAIYQRPRHPYTQALLRAVPEPDPSRGVARDLPRGEIPDAVSPPLGCSFHPRCARAFEPCGWERRDVATMLESRWATMAEEDWRAERALVGDLGALAEPGEVARLVPGRDASTADLLGFLQRLRREGADPFWQGVGELAVEDGAVTVRFAPAVDPGLVVDGPVEVACLLYGRTPHADHTVPDA